MRRELQEDLATVSNAPAYRIDQKLHQILYKEPARPTLEPAGEKLPEPIYPLHPDPVEMSMREYQKQNALRGWKSWGSPYFKSRWHSGDLRPGHTITRSRG
jgi:hypothetical protein